MTSNVLIVDDESKFLKSLSQGLYMYSSQFSVLTAENGIEALEILRSNTIDLLITDLKMPKMDGFELMSTMSTEFPLIPVVVISAYTENSTEETVKHAGALRILEKPVDLDELSDTILTSLNEGKNAEENSGISLPSFLQLIEIEGKSCALVVSIPENGEGYFLFKDGKLFQAFYDKQKGKDAALTMLAHDNMSIKVRGLPKKTIRNEMQCGIIPLLMESAQRRDESASPAEQADNERDSVQFDTICRADNSLESESPTITTRELAPIPPTTEGNIITLENILNKLKPINGVKAVGIMNFSGELLASISNNEDIKLDLIGAIINDIFHQAQEACEKIGLSRCEEAIIGTPDGSIIIQCSGLDSASHIRLVGVLKVDGNKALFKMQSMKLLPKLTQELG